MNKHYLGDGVYVEITQEGLLLTTEDGIKVTNKIYLELRELRNLVEYIERNHIL